MSTKNSMSTKNRSVSFRDFENFKDSYTSSKNIIN